MLFRSILVPRAQRELLHAVEEHASKWFDQEEDAKAEQAGAYGHVDRKFTGYRNGKFREQLELRQTSQGSLYPQVGMGPFAAVATDGLSPAVSLYMRWIDAWARALLRHIAHDLGASPRFFDALCDPQPAGAARRSH